MLNAKQENRESATVKTHKRQARGKTRRKLWNKERMQLFGVTLKNNINKFIYTKVYTVEHLWILSQEKADGEVYGMCVFKD